MATKRKRVEATQEELIKSMYPDLPTREDEVTAAAATTDGDKPKQDDTVAALQKQIAAMQAQMETFETERMALMAQPVVHAPPQRPQPKALPNPVEDPDGYAETVRANAKAEMDYERQVNSWQTTQVQTHSNKLENLYNNFAEKYEDYAADTEKLGIVAEAVAKKAKARGLDVNKYMFQTSNLYMKDVVKEFDRLFGKPGGDEIDEDDDDEQDNRTTGVFGGSQQGGRPAAGKQQEPLGSLAQELIAFQKKAGIRY